MLPPLHVLPTPTFGEAHGADGRVAEDDGGGVTVVQLEVLLALQESVHHLSANSDRGEGRKT